MRKILITWYGITDLKASFNIEYSNGPILSALLADDYTDVLILGYTNQEKNQALSDEFIHDLKNAKENFTNNNPAEVWNFVNKYANTEIAHNNFIDWIKQELQNNNKNTEVAFYPVVLSHLNDTEGIYNIAVQALDVIANWNIDKEVYFYLSPGTPVMAFVWAFVALRHPNMKKKLLVSPVINKKPEIISLPSEWLEWHSKTVNENGEHIEKYDIVFHLFGEQRMPSLLGILQFDAKKHVFVNSKQYPAAIMKQFLGKAEFAELYVEPFDPLDVKKKILAYLQDYSNKAKIGFNLTGGTKLMYAGALSACKKINATPFYFDIFHDKVIFLDDFKTKEIKPITSVETFITLHSNNLYVSKKGIWEDIPSINIKGRSDLTKLLWKNRSKIAKLYRSIVPYVNDRKKFSIKKNDINIDFNSNGNVSISIDKQYFSFSGWIDFPVYITGGWFEEYTYMQLKPFVENGTIYDLRIGLEIGFKEQNSNKSSFGFENLKNIFGDTYQELDITFTDGKKLYIVECKAGNIKSDFIMKLQTITKYFGGLKGQGILVSCFPPNNKIVQKKIDDSQNITLITGKNLYENFKAFLDN